MLGDIPWRDTAGLYWAEVEINAPGTEGFFTWEVKFQKPDLELRHEGAAYTFAFRTARPPEHVVTVEVIDKGNKTPIKNADVRLHSRGATYGDRTGEDGVAKVEVPQGEYGVDVFAARYVPLEMTAAVAGDVTIKAELLVPAQEW